MATIKDNKTANVPVNGQSASQTHVPALRFPEFYGEWEKCLLGEIAIISKGYGISKDQLSPTGRPCILYGELYTKYPSEIITDIVSKTEVSMDNLVESQQNDIIIPCSGETAIDIATARCVTQSNVLLGSDLNIIRLKEGDGAYMCYQLNGRRRSDIACIAQGVSIVHLYGENIKSISVYCPQMEEQRKISHMLALIDRRTALQSKLIDRISSLIDGINNKIHENIVGEVVSFSEIGEAYSGLSGKSAQDFGNGKPFVTYMNVYQNSHIDSSCYEYVNINETETQNKVRHGDVLFTLSSETPEEVGVGAVYLGDDEELYLNSFCFGVHITAPDKVYSPYLAYLVSNRKFREAVFPLAQGSTRFNLQKGDFMKMKFILPSLENQRHIASLLDSFANKLRVEKDLLTAYSSLKSYLLLQMFI